MEVIAALAQAVEGVGAEAEPVCRRLLALKELTASEIPDTIRRSFTSVNTFPQLVL